jgi:hypothetical protein
MDDISFLEWFFLGMPWELVVVGLVLGVIAIIFSLIGGGIEKVRDHFNK